MQLEKIRAAAERVATSEGMEVVEVEWKIGRQRFLRVTIDKPDGVGHLDCERVSNQLSVLLDVEELVPGGSYILEVSSPGLDRKLLKESDYQRFAGRKAKVWLSEPVENSHYWEGRLGGVEEGVVKLEVKDRVMLLPYAGIRKAQLVVEF
jgi:ribosome maturation factor RimP